MYTRFFRHTEPESDTGNYVKAQARSYSADITHALLYRSSRHLRTSFDRLGALFERLNS
jgi:hypothetical protein